MNGKQSGILDRFFFPLSKLNYWVFSLLLGIELTKEYAKHDCEKDIFFLPFFCSFLLGGEKMDETKLSIFIVSASLFFFFP